MTKFAKLITETSFDVELSESKGDKEFKIVGIYSSAEVMNNNNRKYKKDTLSREVDKIMEKVKNKCLWGELGHCVPGDSEILTQNGWKQIKDIANDEIVATLNTNTNDIEYHQIHEKIDEHYSGKMVHLKNRQIDMLFTPEHRHLLVDRYGKYFFANSNEILNHDIKGYDKCHIPKIGKWDGKDDEVFVFEGIDTPFSKQYREWQEPLELDMSLFIPILGLYLSEGNIGKKKGHPVSINITQIKEESSLMIEKLLEKLPNSIHWFKCGNVFSIYDLRMANYFSKFGNCYNKYIPNDIKMLNSMYLSELLYWFGVGDGRHYVDKYGYEKRDIFSTSEKMIDDFSEIAFKCGISCRKTVHIPTKDAIFPDHISKVENLKPLYFLKVLTTNGIYLDKRFMNVNEVDFNDRVYCVNVENNNFYVRNKDSVSFWTGNSPQPELSPDRIAILTESLEWKGNDLYGRSKVLDTPMGNIAKTLIKEGKMGISSRGLGTVDENSQYVNEDFRLICWDLVIDPSNSPSWVAGILEGKEFEIHGIKDEEEITEEEITEEVITEAQAKTEFKKHIWQVIEQIEKNL